ncbi:hypothetical protein BDN72DRAFT_963008 [Pluteus cervinus]|uniref:Uncharacterized protein n=1 Tax=Pluteus cervinus TaxID=181527 RepID=A0ACD3AGE4_9AGAR|nr:hypothetical protein BDN72DRAFT_963008 [Pluteus cervinus]
MATFLPLELELHIFELLVNESPKMAPTLMSLSTYAQNFISSLVYKVMIVYTTQTRREPSMDAIEKYGRHIRHLLFGWELEACGIAALTVYLRTAPNIINLAVWWDFYPEEDWSGLLRRLPLIRLSVSPIHLRWDARGSKETHIKVQNLFAFFPRLTHLDLVWQLPLPMPYIPCLKSLPNLTYISMNFPPSTARSFPDLSNECPGPKAIVIFRHGQEYKEYVESNDSLDGVMDLRVVSCLVPSRVEDWERGARGQPDVYDFGLEILRKRSRIANKSDGV